jgi:hypothetical protein
MLCCILKDTWARKLSNTTAQRFIDDKNLILVYAREISNVRKIRLRNIFGFSFLRRAFVVISFRERLEFGKCEEWRM